MKDQFRTNQELLKEISALKQEIQELEQSESERKRVQKELTRSEEKFRKAFYTSPDSVNINRLEDGMYISINPGFTRILGYTEEEIIGKTSIEYNIWDNIEDRQRLVAGLKKDGTVSNLEAVFRAKGGDIRYGLMSASVINLEGVPHILNITRDITDRKRADAELRQQSDAMNAAIDGMAILNEEGEYVYLNKAHIMVYGYERAEELIGKSWRVLYDSDSLQHFDQEIMPEFSRKGYWSGDVVGMKKDGTKFPQSVSLTAMAHGGLICVVRDITDQKRAEEDLKKSEEKYRSLFENANESIFVAQDGKLVFVNPMTIVVVGYPGEELTARPFSEFIYPDDRGTVIDRHLRRMKGEDLSHNYSFRIIRKNGNIRWVALNAVLISWGGKPATLNFLSDITEKVQAEEGSRRLASVVRHSLELVNLTNPDGTMVFLNETGKKMLGVSEDDIAQTNIMDVIPEHLRDKVQQEVLPSITKDGHWEGDLQYLNVKTGGLTDVHAITFRIDDPGTGTLQFLANVSQNITERKRAEEQLHHTLEHLRKSFSVTIQVMVSAVEARDPYTSGHQLRVADLARSIATEMNLSQSKIEAIRMAGSIHDIGKLSIPAEMLSKPTKLSDIEFSLIKEHSRKGYEMLKNVESPWPLAEIVYQHHERMDGSGYPRNLKGDEILMEARIMAVADVVEAMASHRPYRAGLGIDTALKEIEDNRGGLYDEAVADACLRLFREKDFKLKGN